MGFAWGVLFPAPPAVAMFGFTFSPPEPAPTGNATMVGASVVGRIPFCARKDAIPPALRPARLGLPPWPLKGLVGARATVAGAAGAVAQVVLLVTGSS